MCGDPCRLNFLDPVVTRIKSHLSRWKSKHLSFGGRLVLLKFSLTSLPVYVICFFKAPSCIITCLCFFWVGLRIIGKSLGLIGSPFVLTWRLVDWGKEN